MRHINHINHLSGLHHHQKKKKKKTTRTRDNEKKKRQRERDNERRRLLLNLPLMVLLSAELMVLFLVCVSWCERSVLQKTLDSPQKSKKHTKIENPKHFFDGFKNHFFFSPKEARYYFLSQKNITKDVFER